MAGGRGQSSTAVPEHQVQMPAAAEEAGTSKVAKPERLLISFVHFLALVERTGNALGTLAFTWATVVLLGGPDDLRRGDFVTTFIIFVLEAARMFSKPNNRTDYQLFFGTSGAFRHLTWSGMVEVVCFSDVLMCLLIWNKYSEAIDLSNLSILTLMTCRFLCPRLHVHNPLRRALSLWSPMVAIILLGPSVPYSCDDDCSYYLENNRSFTVRASVAKWIVYVVLSVVVLLLTISRMQFSSIIKLADSAMGRKLAFWHKTAINLCMCVAAVMLAVTSGGLWTLIIMSQVTVSFGNLQVPAAILRVEIVAFRFLETGRSDDIGGNTNLGRSLRIFYGLVLGQGILYLVACILQVFSFILRRSLVRRAGFRGQQGVECVDLYYSYAYEKHMEGSILSAKKISIVTYAMKTLKSDTPKMQLHGVQMLHSFLKKEPFRTMTISKLTDSTKTVTSLLKMLGWTNVEHRDIRLFAAKVLAELAESLQFLTIPGAIRQISSLLNTVHQMEIQNPLLDNCRQEEKQETPIQDAEDCLTPKLKFWKQMMVYCLIPVDESSKLLDKQDSYLLKCWKNVTKCCSVPEEGQSVDNDPLPVLGMLIVERLANSDTQNCIEISRAPGLITTIIEFTSNRTSLTEITDTHQALLKGSSLKVLRRLTSTEGRFGVEFRHEVSKHPSLLSNLAGILDDNRSSQELRELTAEILRNLAMDENTRGEIGHFRAIIIMLMHAFLSRDAPSVTDSNQPLQIIAGQALAVLAMENPTNCVAMSEEPGFAFVKELTVMIHVDRYRCIAASLLRSMCMYARSMLSKADLRELSYILPKVFEIIMDADGAELEVFAGLSSQICNVIPEDFARELEHGQNKEKIIKGLVNSLNAYINPAANCPGVRRAVVEQAVYMMESDPSYTKCFIKCQMMEALMMVQRKHSRADKYRYFSGDVGLMEHSVPLSRLVTRAKELLMSGNDLYWDSSTSFHK
uniref:Uncharacterized protein n=1 Tax=Avena sativa TaxID=4498 RepID=A0ACD5Y0A7_AVESA